MLTGKELFNTLLQELNDMGLPGMSATLDEMYRSPKFLELDPLMAIAGLVEPEYRLLLLEEKEAFWNRNATENSGHETIRSCTSTHNNSD